MTSLDAMRAGFAAITTTPARILHLEGYGLEPGCFADVVVLDAADPIDAIRTKTARLHVLRRGRTIASTPPRRTSLTLPGRPAEVGLSQSHASIEVAILRGRLRETFSSAWLDSSAGRPAGRPAVAIGS